MSPDASLWPIRRSGPAKKQKELASDTKTASKFSASSTHHVIGGHRRGERRACDLLVAATQRFVLVFWVLEVDVATPLL